MKTFRKLSRQTPDEKELVQVKQFLEEGFFLGKVTYTSREELHDRC